MPAHDHQSSVPPVSIAPGIHQKWLCNGFIWQKSMMISQSISVAAATSKPRAIDRADESGSLCLRRQAQSSLVAVRNQGLHINPRTPGIGFLERQKLVDGRHGILASLTLAGNQICNGLLRLVIVERLLHPRSVCRLLNCCEIGKYERPIVSRQRMPSAPRRDSGTFPIVRRPQACQRQAPNKCFVVEREHQSARCSRVD